MVLVPKVSSAFFSGIANSAPGVSRTVRLPSQALESQGLASGTLNLTDLKSKLAKNLKGLRQSTSRAYMLVNRLAKDSTPLDEANSARLAFIASIAGDGDALRRYDSLEVESAPLTTDEIRLSLLDFGAKQVKVEQQVAGEILGEHAPLSPWLVEDSVVSVDARATQRSIRLGAAKRLPMTPFHLTQAEDIKEAMEPEDLAIFDQMQADLSPLGAEFLEKALAMGYGGEQLENFFSQIEGMSDSWLRQHLTAAEPLKGRGLTQQWSASCAAAAAQAIRAELDPVYALDLHQSNGDITKRWNGASVQGASPSAKNLGPNASLARQQGELSTAATDSGGNLVPVWLSDVVDTSFEGVKDIARLVKATFRDSPAKFTATRHLLANQGSLELLDRSLQQGLGGLLGTVTEEGNGHGVAVLAKVVAEGKQAYLMLEPSSGVAKAVAAEDVARGKFSVSGEVLRPLDFFALSKVF